MNKITVFLIFLLILFSNCLNCFAKNFNAQIIEKKSINQNNIQIEFNKYKLNKKFKGNSYINEFIITNKSKNNIDIPIQLTNLAKVYAYNTNINSDLGIIYDNYSKLEKNRFSKLKNSKHIIEEDETVRFLTFSKNNDDFIKFIKFTELKNEPVNDIQIEFKITGLIEAIKKQDNDVVETFLKSGFNPDSRYARVPMTFLSLYYNNPYALNLFLKYGAQINETVEEMLLSSKKENLLTYAIYKKNINAVNILINHNIDINKEIDKQIPINYAISKNQLKIVEILLKHNVKTNSITYELINKSKNNQLKALFNGILD